MVGKKLQSRVVSTHRYPCDFFRSVICRFFRRTPSFPGQRPIHLPSPAHRAGFSRHE